jgi:hypothetical protein
MTGGPTMVQTRMGELNNPIYDDDTFAAFLQPATSQALIINVDDNRHIVGVMYGGVTDPGAGAGTLVMNSSVENESSVFKTLLHEAGHGEEYFSSPRTIVVSPEEQHVGVPTTEYISTLYGIRASEILAPLIGPEAAAELMLKQVIQNRWITTGSININP